MKNKEQILLQHTKYWENVGQLSVFIQQTAAYVQEYVCLPRGYVYKER